MVVDRGQLIGLAHGVHGFRRGRLKRGASAGIVSVIRFIVANLRRVIKLIRSAVVGDFQRCCGRKTEPKDVKGRERAVVRMMGVGKEAR